jgi:DNA/RNA-binding domain of Phe-tRNA-synthetase-like protein
MKKITVSKDLLSHLPHVKIVDFLSEVKVEPLNEALTYAMDSRLGIIQSAFEVGQIASIDNIKWGRTVYRKLGKDPTKYRLSSEKLIRRVIKGEGIEHINNVVDLANWLSVELKAPIGVYDVNKIKGDIVMDYGRSGETYRCLAGYELNLEGLPLLRDDFGPFGSSTADSVRTAVDENTTQAILCIYLFNPEEEESEYLKMTTSFFKRL